VAHTILVIAYHILSRGATYEELGGDYFDCRTGPRRSSSTDWPNALRDWATKSSSRSRRPDWRGSFS